MEKQYEYKCNQNISVNKYLLLLACYNLNTLIKTLINFTNIVLLLKLQINQQNRMSIIHGNI